MNRFLLPLILLFFAVISKAQTTLAPGDILFTGYNSTPSAFEGDLFSFVLLKDVSANTIIGFTDRGYTGSDWVAADGNESSFMLEITSNLAAGTEIYYQGLSCFVYDPTTQTSTFFGLTTVTSAPGPNGISLSDAGDQVIAFQSSNGRLDGTGLTMLAGLNFSYAPSGTSAAAWNYGSAGSIGPNSSLMPPGLTSSVSAFYTGTIGTTTIPTSGRFNNCALTSNSNPTAIRTAIMDPSNWELRSTLPALTIPSACSFSLPVIWESVTASVKDRSLQISWRTSSETNNSYFEVQASTDGKTFTTLEKVESQAPGGTTSTPIDYHIKIDLTDMAGTAGLGLATLLLLMVSSRRRRRRRTISALAFILSCAFFYGCSKESSKSIDTHNQKIYIRIAQIDKDGTTDYSKVVQVINE